MADGKWSYDQGANTAWSNFKHPSNWHASPVKIGNQTFKSGCTTPGEWPLASGTKNGGSIPYHYDPNCCWRYTATHLFVLSVELAIAVIFATRVPFEAWQQGQELSCWLSRSSTVG